MFDKLRESLEAKAKRLARPDLEELGFQIGGKVSQAIVKTSSKAEGGWQSYQMLENSQFIGTVEPTDNGYRVGIGKEQAPEQSPSGTIAAFLADFPQYKRKVGKKGSFAWWGLSLEARAKLAQERQSGKYGGVQGKSHYWVQQNEGMASVGIKPRQFIEEGLKSMPSEIDRIIREALRG